jgi:hypothetical protein
MALTISLDYSTSLGSQRLQAWTITGDGSIKRFRHGLLRAVACWAQNEDDTTKTGTSVIVSGVSVHITGAAITSGKKYKVFVLGE